MPEQLPDIPQIYKAHPRGERLYQEGFRFNSHGDLAMDAGLFCRIWDEQHPLRSSIEYSWYVPAKTDGR